MDFFFYWSSYRHKLPGHPPPSLPCIHRSPDWSLQSKFCKTRGILYEVKPEFRMMTDLLLAAFPMYMKHCCLVSVLKVYLCTERRCRSSLHWSIRQCSLGRTPLRNRGHSCTFRPLRESRRHRTSRFHDRVCQSPPHRLQRIKSAQIQTPFH